MRYEDERGYIQDVAEGEQVIFTRAGFSRASHFHKSSGHICVLTRGSMDYYERRTGSDDKPIKLTLIAPVRFDTGPMLDHTMKFLEDSEFYCKRTGGSYTHEQYENDIVRLGYSLEDVYNEWEDEQA
jgi:hypothetical protein